MSYAFELSHFPFATKGGSSEEDDDEERSVRPGVVVTNEDDGTPSSTSTTVLSLVVGKGQLSLCTTLPVDEVMKLYSILVSNPKTAQL